MTKLTFGKYVVELSKEDKVLFPKSGYTKRDLVDYYVSIAEYMIPQIKDRPLTLKRYPNGIQEKGFFQKNISEYFPDWLEATEVPRKGLDNICMVVGNNAATLAYLANQGTITFHSWLSKKDKKFYPDRMIFDLDPATNDFKIVKEAALLLKDFLENELDLKTFLMLTGSKGMHLVVPISRDYGFDEVKAFAKDIGQLFSIGYPDKFTIEHRIKKREGRLFIDYLRNEFAQTGIAPYSVRAIEGAPVATPIDWDDLNNSALTSQQYNIKNIFEKFEKKDDPWKEINRYGKSLAGAMKKVSGLLEEKK